MKKIFVFIISIFMFLQTIPQFAAEEEPSALIKYLVPAKITKLDWILLKFQVYSAKKIKWDDYELIDSIDIYTAYEKDKYYIGLNFFIDNSSYIRLENHIVKKTFLNVIEGAASIIKIIIPELKFEKDILAIFAITETHKIIAKYIDGKFEFIE